MPDFQLCYGVKVDDKGMHDCGVRLECKRFMTKGDGHYQAYGAPADDFTVKHGCEYRIRMESV